jgi:hypothetical protein
MKISLLVQRSALACATACLLVPLLATASQATKTGGSGAVAPATPTAVTLSSANRSLAVSWSESSTGTITYVATATAAAATTKTCKSHAMACTITGLTNGVIYDVTVVGSTSGGSSAPSADVTQMVGIPGAPLSVHTSAATASAVIAWAPPKASGVSAITSYMATATPGGFSCSSSGTLLNPPVRSCEIPGLASGTKYTVTVTATNAYGTGVPSKEAVVTPN